VESLVSVNSYAPARRRIGIGGILGAVVVVILVVVAAGAVRNAVRGDDSPVLPDTFAGRARIASAQDFGQATDWRRNAEAAVDGAGISGAAYGTVAEGRVNVTAARADLAGKLDLLLVADDGAAYGDVRCSRDLTYVSPAKRSSVLLCWHTSAERSVLALSVTNPPAPEQLAGDVEALWQKLA
jgi:hypothetical protein